MVFPISLLDISGRNSSRDQTKETGFGGRSNLKKTPSSLETGTPTKWVRAIFGLTEYR